MSQQELREAIYSVRDKYGVITPKHVLEEARVPTSPLHSQFEWDDSVAAEGYRLNQARELLRSFKIRYAGKDGVSDLREFVSIRRPDSAFEREYVPVEEALSDPISARILLGELKRELEALKRRYGHLQEFGQLLREAGEHVA